MGPTACAEPQCLYKGALYLYLTVELYLYSPYGPHGLYRASVLAQGYTHTRYKCNNLYSVANNNEVIEVSASSVNILN